jgi:hypothetical protein
MTTYLEQLSLEDAITVLRILSEEHHELAGRIEVLAKAQIIDINEDYYEQKVYQALIGIDVEQMWSRSFVTMRSRYSQPSKVAHELIEEALKPYADLLSKYRKLSMYTEVSKIGRGIVKGVLRFVREGQTEFKEWAPDDALEWLGGLLVDWELECKEESERTCIEHVNKLFWE